MTNVTIYKCCLICERFTDLDGVYIAHLFKIIKLRSPSFSFDLKLIQNKFNYIFLTIACEI